MKKIAFLILAGFLSITAFDASAQATESTNAVTSSASYLGTSNSNNVIFKRNNSAAGLLATTKTYFGVGSNAMASSVSFGNNAGEFASGNGFCTYIGYGAGTGSNITSNSGTYNSFFGYNAGFINSNGSYNTFLGTNSGETITTGTSNTFIGNYSGSGNNGNNNVFIGVESAVNNNGNNNVVIGNSASSENTSGSNNTIIGTSAGFDSNGSGNVFIGYQAGSGSAESNTLFVDNSATGTPLIWGDFSANQVKLNGKVGIGAISSFPSAAGSVNVSGYNLFVTGGILTDEVRIYASSGGTWADYVFAEDYKLPTLDEVEKHIREKGHLMNVPSADEVCENGIALGEMAKIQQEKIEELILYVIEQNKINEKQTEELNAQQKEIEELKALATKMLEK
jgi:hypothetical protein